MLRNELGDKRLYASVCPRQHEGSRSLAPDVPQNLSTCLSGSRMQHTAVARASDDFYPRDPTSSHPHIAACAYNTLFLSAILHVRRAHGCLDPTCVVSDAARGRPKNYLRDVCPA